MRKPDRKRGRNNLLPKYGEEKPKRLPERLRRRRRFTGKEEGGTR